MTAEDDAYEAARRLIAEAKASGAEKLDLDIQVRRALTRLPPEIGELGALRTLYLRNTRITDLDPLAGLTELTSLSLSNTRIARLDPLAGLTGLRLLSLNHTQVKQLDPLAGLTGLRELSLHNTQVERLDPLAALTGLKALSLNNTPVERLDPLAGLTGLRVLWLSNTKVARLDPLAGLTGLKTLLLDNTPVERLDPLAGLTGLTELSLGNTKRLADLRPIMGGLVSLIPGENEKGPLLGLYFKGSHVCNLDPEGLGQLAEIADDRERTEKTLAYLRNLTVWPPGRGRAEEAELLAALEGPVLSQSLADIAQPGPGEPFVPVPMPMPVARAPDADYEAIVETLRYAADRLGQTAAENRLGREVVQSCRDYSQQLDQRPHNPRLLHYIASTLRGALTDPDIAPALDGFDRGQIGGLLQQHDHLIADYFPQTLRLSVTNAAAPIAEIEKAKPKINSDLQAALAQGVADSMLDPAVSTPLEIIERQQQAAHRRRMIAASQDERAAGEEDERRGITRQASYIGRIVTRLKLALIRLKDNVRTNPRDALGTATDAAYWLEKLPSLIEKLEAVWNLIKTLI